MIQVGRDWSIMGSLEMASYAYSPSGMAFTGQGELFWNAVDLTGASREQVSSKRVVSDLLEP